MGPALVARTAVFLDEMTISRPEGWLTELIGPLPGRLRY